jgi:carboxymethylenebutenolidase
MHPLLARASRARWDGGLAAGCGRDTVRSFMREAPMADEESTDDTNDSRSGFGKVTRRELGSLAVGTGITAMLPSAVHAADVTEHEVTIKTPHGTADAYFVSPASGKYPAVIVWTDIFGLRPAFRQMGKRLAQLGYAVLVPNPFYRKQKAPVVPEGASFQDPATRETLMGLMKSLAPDDVVSDSKAYIAFLDKQPSVDGKRKLSMSGYCMGGPITMRAAAAFPERIGAAASFHGGGLVTDKPDSPHLLVPKIKAHYLFAIAENDDQKQPEAKEVLRQAFAKSKVPAEIEVYAGAMHGWCPPDSQAYNKVQAEKAWSRMLELFKRALNA